MADAYLGRRLVAAARLARLEARVAKAIEAALGRRRLAVRANALTAAALHPDAFDEDAWDTDLMDEVEPVIAEMLAELARSATTPFSLAAGAEARVLGRIDLQAQVEQFVRQVRGIGPETAARIIDALSHGVGLGEGIPDLAARVDSVFAMASRKALTIARTETNKAANRGLNEAATAVNSELALTKTWLATGDEKTREDHADADGQTVAFDDQFDVGGEAADFPCDPALSAGNVINCRCTLTFEAADAAQDLSPEEQAAADEAAAQAAADAEAQAE